ncbi:hypothetical protein NHX12_011889 [Muraenolepis orangiensis]|uniref:Uncharacterized protein n=1 Tax=Muraenolepis orangiensis TaxID=630683 RepID=A0A9Q0I989_9TELE|nr:hypothetical protein NHX12_011889 [Muraenolepis orangiensis]
MQHYATPPLPSVDYGGQSEATTWNHRLMSLTYPTTITKNYHVSQSVGSRTEAPSEGSNVLKGLNKVKDCALRVEGDDELRKERVSLHKEDVLDFKIQVCYHKLCRAPDIKRNIKGPDASQKPERGLVSTERLVWKTKEGFDSSLSLLAAPD